MRTLTDEELKKITFGAIACGSTDDGIRFFRCTEKQVDACRTIAEDFAIRALATTGIRLDFYTDSRQLEFDITSGGKFELWLDGVFRGQFGTGDERTFSLPLCNVPGESDGEKRVTLYYPNHSIGVLKQVRLEDGATLRAAEYRQRFLFLGDSITQGWNARYDSLSYVNRVARIFDADFVNQGISGALYQESLFDRIPYEPDTVVVAFGTNDLLGNRSAETLRFHASRYLASVREAYHASRIYVITPIRLEDHIGKAMTFAECAETIREMAEMLGMTVIDGLKLVPDNTEFFADPVHPNDAGFGLYAESLCRILLTQ